MSFKRGPIAALAVATIMGGMIVSPAIAKKKPKEEEATSFTLSAPFRALAAQAQASIAAGNSTAAAGQVAELKRTAVAPSEKYVAGQLALQYAAWRGDMQGQRLALSAILDSNAAPAAETPRLRYLAGYLSNMLGEQGDAIAQVNYARQLGYVNRDSAMLLADATLRKTKGADGMQFADEAAKLDRQAGRAEPASWYDRAGALAYQGGKWGDVARWYQEKLSLYPTAPNWRSAIVNYLAAPGIDPQAQLDLYRLMSATGALASERDFQAYATAAAARGFDGEARAAIEAGRSSANLTATDPATAKLFSTVSPKAVKAAAGLPAQAKKAESASNGQAAMAAGDLYFSLAQYPQAAKLYHTAISKGGIDDARTRTRLGVALARSGDLPGAKTALSQVPAGPWSTVAGFWSVWVDLQIKRNATAQGITPTSPAS